MGNPPEPMPGVHAQGFGRYGKLTPIASGGAADVFAAWDQALDRPVAIKVLRESLTDRQLRQFEREALTAGRLGQHPNILTVFEAGVEMRRPFIVMELAGRGSLADRIRDSGPLAIQPVLDISAQLSAALEFAHSRGVIHRDVKPENILFTAFGVPVIADFGISALEDMSNVTTEGLTPLYAPPEVLEGRAYGFAGDIYAFASTIYKALTGRAPFQGKVGESIMVVMRRIIADPPRPLDGHDIPEEFASMLLRMLSKDPERRPRLAEFVRAVNRSQQSLGLEMTRVVLSNDDETVGRSANESITVYAGEERNVPELEALLRPRSDTANRDLAHYSAVTVARRALQIEVGRHRKATRSTTAGVLLGIVASFAVSAATAAVPVGPTQVVVTAGVLFGTVVLIPAGSKLFRALARRREGRIERQALSLSLLVRSAYDDALMRSNLRATTSSGRD